MAKNWKHTSYKKQVKTQFERKVGRALSAIGHTWERLAAEEIHAQPKFKNKQTVGRGAIDEGAMLNSNAHVINKQRREITVGNNINYALYVTYGTRKMPARPWFQNSILNHIEDYEAIVEAEFGG